MADQEPTGEKATQGEPAPAQASQNEIADELREMGTNIMNFLQALWESQERKRVQKDIEAGLANLGTSINQAAKEFQQSPTGQRVKDEFEEISERIRTGEIETNIRRDFMAALKTANAELEKALNKMSSSEKDQTGSQPDSKT